MNPHFDPTTHPKKDNNFYFYHPSGKMVILIKLIEKWFSKNIKMSDLDYLNLCEFVEDLFTYRHNLEKKHLEKWKLFQELYLEIKQEEEKKK